MHTTPYKFRKEIDYDPSKSRKPNFTIEMAHALMRYLIDNELDGDVKIYYQYKGTWFSMKSHLDFYRHQDYDYTQVQTKYRNKDYVWYVNTNDDPNEYFEYNGKYLSMSFEGPLYHALHYGTERVSNELNNFFSHYGLYKEYGNSWNLSVYDI